MKRNVKNGIFIGIIILMIAAMFLTNYYAKKNITNTSGPNTEMMGNPPSMGNNQSGDNTPPAQPDDNQSNDNSTTQDNANGGSSQNNQGTPPEKPSGDDNNNNQMPEMPNMTNSSNKTSAIYYVLFAIEGLVLSLSLIYLIMSNLNKKTTKETFKSTDKIVIYVLSVLLLTIGSFYINNKSLTTSKTESSGPDNNNQTNKVEYQATTEITEDKEITDENYGSTTSDENSVLVSGNTVTIKNSSITKDGANLTLKNITVTTNATGANDVFSYGGSATTNNASSDGTTVNISDSKITTTKDNSGGIMTTGGGIMNATNLTIKTSGTSSAAIRSDGGGGEVNVNKGTYQTDGVGSPIIYSTANITVKNAKLIATKPEGVVIEGKNSVTLENVDLTDTNNKLNGQSTTYKNIFLYQSMSGDASDGEATFTAKNSNIVTNKGDTFYITNTSATINLSNNTITNNDKTGNFLRSKKDSWGNDGSNGGDTTLNMTNQSAIGNIVIDEISTLKMNLKDSSYYEGTINGDNSAKSIKLVLDKTSKIKLTGDSYVTSLEDSDTDYSNIDFNGYKLYVNGKAIN
ncbi:MAG: hypothetical protein PUB03_04490 [bacterium]|nr:hypothetical protein [bacterium]